MKLQDELKKIEQQEAELLKKKQELQAQLEREKELEEKLGQVLQFSGYPTARHLIKALMARYEIRSISLKEDSDEAPGRRKRTKVTPELRDQIKHAVQSGTLSKNGVAKQFNVSYLVVNKVLEGKYDQN